MTREQFIEMVSAEQESLRRFLRGLCSGDGSRADDIAQEALLKAYLSFERFEGRARFSTWLFRIAYNCFYDHMRRLEKEVTADNAKSEVPDLCHLHSIPDELSSADRRFEHQHLYQAIGALGKKEQAVILLFYMEEKSIKEIAVITDMSSGAVRVHLFRGRKHLKQYLKEL